MQRRLATVAALSLVIASPAASFAQPRLPSLVALTMNTGTVLIVEVNYESGTELKVFNLDTGQTEEFRKSANYKKVSPTEAKLLPPKVDVSGKRPDALEAVQSVPLTASTPELFKRLGSYPENLAKYVAWSVGRSAQGARTTVAVLPMSDTRGQRTGETERRAEELTGALSRRGVELVERARIDQVVGELVTQQGELFDDAVAQKVGRQVGASAVVVGSLSPRGGKADLNLRIVDVGTGVIIDAPTLKEITGLPRERVPLQVIAAGGPTTVMSIVGKWMLKFSIGRDATLVAYPNGTFVLNNGARGRWAQTGDDLTFFIPKPGQRKGARPEFVKFIGRLGPRGLAFRATNGDGVTVDGRRP